MVARVNLSALYLPRVNNLNGARAVASCLPLRPVADAQACFGICMAWVIVPLFVILVDIYGIAIITLMTHHPFYFCLFVVLCGLLSGKQAVTFGCADSLNGQMTCIWRDMWTATSI